MVDRVKPLKIESGDFTPTETDPTEDYIAAKGIAFDDLDSSTLDVQGGGSTQLVSSLPFKATDFSSASLASGRVLFTGASGLITNSATLLWSGSVLGVNSSQTGRTGVAIGGAVNPGVRISEGDDSTSYSEWVDLDTNNSRISKIGASGSVNLDLNPIPSNGTGVATINMFNAAATTGNHLVQVQGASCNTVITLQSGGNGNYSALYFVRERQSAANLGAASIRVMSDTSSNDANLAIVVTTSMNFNSAASQSQFYMQGTGAHTWQRSHADANLLRVTNTLNAVNNFNFQHYNLGSSAVTFATINSVAEGVSVGIENGRLDFYTIRGGTQIITAQLTGEPGTLTLRAGIATANEGAQINMGGASGYLSTVSIDRYQDDIRIFGNHSSDFDLLLINSGSGRMNLGIDGDVGVSTGVINQNLTSGVTTGLFRANMFTTGSGATALFTGVVGVQSVVIPQNTTASNAAWTAFHGSGDTAASTAVTIGTITSFSSAMGSPGVTGTVLSSYFGFNNTYSSSSNTGYIDRAYAFNSGAFLNLGGSVGTFYGLRLGSVAVANTQYGFYVEPTYNIIEGNLRIGSGSTPFFTLEVTGEADFENTVNFNRENITTTGTINDLAPLTSFCKLSGSGAITLNGIVQGWDGQILILYKSGTGNLTINNESGSATSASYRILTMTGGAVTITTPGCATLIYDTDASRWIITSVQA